MKLYNIYMFTDVFGNKVYVDTTNDLDKWLAESNKQRIAEGNEADKISDFEIEEVIPNIYSEEE